VRPETVERDVCLRSIATHDHGASASRAEHLGHPAAEHAGAPDNNRDPPVQPEARRQVQLRMHVAMLSGDEPLASLARRAWSPGNLGGLNVR
jgi:hypothetical protein